METTLLMEQQLKIETSVNTAGTEVNKIIDQEGVMIAKVNGPSHLSICWAMVRAFNERQNIDRMKSLLRNRLIEILKQAKGSSVWDYSIRKVFNENGNINHLIEELISQVEDSPGVMITILGGEAVQILQLL